MTINKQNLKVPTSEQARLNGRKGGKKSAENKRKRKAMAEQMKLLMSQPMRDENIKRKIKNLGIGEDNIDAQMALCVAIWQKALKGDVSAFNAIRELVGERVIEVNMGSKQDEKVKEIEAYLDAKEKEE